MSAKRSFDVRRKPATRSAPTPTRGRRTQASRPTKAATAKKRASALSERRREAKHRLFWLYVGLAVLLVGVVIYGFWRPEVRIATVQSEDTTLVALAKEALEGTYGYVIPRDSIFFYPERDVRQAVLDARPEVSAVSVSRSGLTAISIDTIERTVAFWWCGTPESASAGDSSCYEADAEGFIFRPAGVVDASSTPVGTALRMYAELEDATSTPDYPLRGKMESLESVPDVLRFVKAMKALGVSPVSLAIRGDEADLFVPSSGRGTRITYVLGREEAAAKLAAAVFPRLNLTDGSIEYVDLRFNGKAYIKRRE